MDMHFQERPTFKGGTEIFMYRTQIPTQRAQLAMAFVERWGMVAGKTDGEDSAGRQKLALHTPAEVVDRACQMADLLWEELNKRGWLLEVPAPKSESK